MNECSNGILRIRNTKYPERPGVASETITPGDLSVEVLLIPEHNATTFPECLGDRKYIEVKAKRSEKRWEAQGRARECNVACRRRYLHSRWA